MTLISLLLPMVAATTPATPPPVLKASDAPIRLWMNNDGQFRAGDYARIQVDAESDGFLLVLQYDPMGRLRVLFPLDPRDDDRVQAGRRYEVREDGGQYAFRADGDGPGMIYSAISQDPWRFDDVVRDGRWDYDRLSIAQDSNDPEREMTELAQSISGPSGFDYDVQDYRVYGASGTSGTSANNTTVVYRDYGYGYDPYSYCDWYWSYSGCRSLRFGLSFGYDPYYYYGYPSRYSYPYYYPYYPRIPVAVHPHTPSAVVDGRPRRYTVTPLRPRSSVVTPSIDWRNRGTPARAASRPSGWTAPAARPSRPRSERNDFRGADRVNGRDWSAPSRPGAGARPSTSSRPETRSRPPASSRPEARSRPEPSRSAPQRGGDNGHRGSGSGGGQARGHGGGGGGGHSGGGSHGRGRP